MLKALLRQLSARLGFTLLTSRIYHRKIILPGEEEQEFAEIFQRGQQRLALDRHFYYFPWTLRY
jgi:hypothetical protein